MGRTKLALIASGIALVSGCAPDADSDLARLALPVAGSDRSQGMWDLWLGAWIAVLVVFLLVVGLILWSMFRYRRRSDDEVPNQVRYNLPIEALYTIAPVIAVAIFFFHTVSAQNNMLEKVDNPEHTITVVGSRWRWAFNYLDEDATSGEDVYDFGIPEDPADLYLPVDESVRFDLKSPDVIHSFWVPEFYFKLDVIPGKVNSFDMTPNRTGTFTGRCAELCGLHHSRMIFKVHVVTRAEYDKHLAELKTAGQIGAPEGAEYADTLAGLEPQNGDEQ